MLDDDVDTSSVNLTSGGGDVGFMNAAIVWLPAGYVSGTPINQVLTITGQNATGGRQPHFVAEAEVARHAVGASGENQGMGLRFTSYHDGHLDRLSRFLESMYA